MCWVTALIIYAELSTSARVEVTDAVANSSRPEDVCARLRGCAEVGGEVTVLSRCL